MKELLLLRHAKSSWKNANLTDHDRPLKKRGKRDAPRMGRLLRDEELVPDLIITSSAERALATAELVALACGYEDELQITRALYHAAPVAYVDVVRELPDKLQRVMLVGHNPGLEELLLELIGWHERMPTATVAHLSLPIRTWREMSIRIEAELLNLWRPKEL